MASADGDNLDLEDQGGVGWDNTSSSLSTISVVRWAGEGGLGANLKSNESLIPSFDDLSGTNGELKWLSSVVAAVEFLSV